jgi:hypothetical protein
MGTRAQIEFFEGDVCVASIYRQFDGYPSGAGLELAEFLLPRRIVNGIGAGDNAENAANGIGCLAAQFVAYAKDGIGGIYLCHPLAASEDSGVSFVYRVKGNRNEPLVIEVDDSFKGSVDEFASWCKKDHE